MGKFTVIPQDTFDGLQMDAGVILTKFNPAMPVAPDDEDIVCATTGGITVSCAPTYSDLGSDVDNCPVNMRELKHLDSWECKISFTSLGTSAESIKMSLGCADIDSETGAIKPRKDLSQSDFGDLWWVGDRADGGCVAVQLKNALSTGGFSLKTTKSGKGQVSMELTGHVALADQTTMPMVIYSIDPSGDTYYSISQILSHVSSDLEETSIKSGEELEVTLTADDDYTISTVLVFMGGVDISSTAWNSGTGKVTIVSVSGNVAITATATSN